MPERFDLTAAEAATARTVTEAAAQELERAHPRLAVAFVDLGLVLSEDFISPSSPGHGEVSAA